MAKPLGDLAAAFDQAVGQFRQGRAGEAEKICARMLKALPSSFDALHLLGVIRLQTGKPAAALQLFERALRVTPDAPEVLSNMALALAGLQREPEALVMFGKALALNSRALDTLNNRGSLLLRRGRAHEALADFERVLALEPRHLGARLNLGHALVELGRLQEALTQYGHVVAEHPQLPEAYYSRGQAYHRLGQPAEAVADLDRALVLRPGYSKALRARGAALQALGRFPEALAQFRAVLTREPDNADAHHDEALVLLTLGDYPLGFRKYEYRWRRTGMPAQPRNLGKPLWLGEYPLARKTILLHAEQGLGDIIQFVRYACVLARQGATVILEVPRELAEILARVDGVARVVERGSPLPLFDVHCPLGSLPLACRTEVSTIPNRVPYLTPAETRLAKWRSRLAPLPSPRVAVAWAGNPAHPNDRNRSIPLARLAPLMSHDAISFVGIQRDPSAEDAAVLARLPRLLDLGRELADFEDTAALMSLVDLVITVDTSVAHLAGALARPAWVMLPFWPDWRWMLDRDDSAWYPTLRLFRQRASGDWDNVLARVQKELAALR